MRDAARAFVRAFGVQEGLHRFGRAIGEGERRARAIHAGEARRIEAHEYLRAVEAQQQLLLQQRESLARELEVVEARLGRRSDGREDRGGMVRHGPVGFAHG